MANQTTQNNKKSNEFKPHSKYNTSTNTRKFNKKHSLDEKISFIKESNKTIQKMALANLRLLDKAVYDTYTKSKLRSYLGKLDNLKNQEQLRQMSAFLERVSMPYKRILKYYASIPLFRWHMTPKINPLDNFSKDDIVNEYIAVSNYIEKMKLSSLGEKAIYYMLRDGVYYGFIYEGKGKDDFYIQRLDPSYCRIFEVESGVYNFGFNLSYFDKRQHLLDSWDKSFKVAYNKYLSNKKANLWMVVDPKQSICLKADDNLNLDIPYFTGIFESIIDLIDARALQKNKDIIENYKLIVQKMPLMSGGGLDDFKLEYETALTYYQMLADSVPENVGVALSPMEIDTVDFKPDDRDNDLVANSMKNVFSDSGTSELLFNMAKSGKSGLEASITTDVGLVKEFVRKIELWLNRFLAYRYDKIVFKVDILDINIFNESVKQKEEMALANNGVPNKMRLAASIGLTPSDVLINQMLENDVLEIHNNWIPLQTSYTLSSSDETGRPQSDERSDDRDEADDKL